MIFRVYFSLRSKSLACFIVDAPTSPAFFQSGNQAREGGRPLRHYEIIYAKVEPESKPH